MLEVLNKLKIIKETLAKEDVEEELDSTDNYNIELDEEIE